MRRTLAVTIALFLAGGACTPDPTDQPSPRAAVTTSPALTREQQWAEDIDDLLDRMEGIHPDLYHGVSPDALRVAAEDLMADLAVLDDDQILVGVMRLVALISAQGRDGHMGVWPPDNPGRVHRYPIRFWEFPDGLHVTAARPPNAELVGATLVAVSGIPIQDVLLRLDPVVPRDNDSNLRAARLVYLTSAEVLAGLGIASDPAQVEMEFRDASGARRITTLRAIDAATYQGWVDGWELALPERPDLLFLRDEQDPFWIRYLGRDRALYVQYNHVDPSSSDLADAIRDAMRRHAVERLVVDLRNNGGGEAEGYFHLLRLLTSRDIDRPRLLYVLIGRLTFSAAASFVAELERKSRHVVFVGEPTGGAPNFWADTVPVTLPNSGVKALVSETYEGYGRAGDQRLAIEPDLSVALSWEDYAAGRDPVLQAALDAPA